VLEHDEPVNRGSNERPLSDDEVRVKFRRNAARALPEAQIDALSAAVQRIDTATSVGELAAALRGAG
jgi:hypothetical protein